MPTATPPTYQYALIIPVYNRPDEIEELLQSLTELQYPTEQFQVIIVEDGSAPGQTCKDIANKYTQTLNISYYYKENSGPGQSRNYGAERADAHYLIYLDSDVLIPPNYLSSISTALNDYPTDAFGGPDRAHPSFTPLQKAINYAMTSMLTTGGIRGQKTALEKFKPRSFNMGYTKAVFNTTGGFGKMRFGEDIDMSLRILAQGYTTQLIPQAYVYHKRRSTLKQFFKQVYNSGLARINLYKLHPTSLKVVHFLPSVFVLGVLGSILLGIFHSFLWLLPLLLYLIALLFDAVLQTNSIKVGLLAIPASFVQLFGYGTGFIYAFWQRLILGKGEQSAFVKNFYR